MAAVRDSLCELPRLEIPRPKYQGMLFVKQQGTLGHYRTLRASSAAQYGKNVKSQGPRRGKLSNDLFQHPNTLKEEEEPAPQPNSRLTTITGHHTANTPTAPSQQMSVSPQPPTPAEVEPDYPDDYVPRHLQTQQRR